ncbi:MAG: hypothetical protein ACFE9S_15450 [Candidatus Hermodarchaeota archaeon]
MALIPNSFEYNLLYTLTLILMISKFLLTIYLSKRVIEKKKERGKFEINFVFGIFILMLGLLISRLIYFYFDFYLTLYDETLLHLMPNVVFWKVANFISSVSFVMLLFIIDWKMLKFKFKGILAYGLLGVALFQLIYPVASAEDFQLISAVGMLGLLIMILIPALFIYIGVKRPELRKTSFIFVLGAIFYFLGSIIESEFIVAPLQALFGANVRFIVFLVTLIIKITGLMIITLSSMKIYF